MNTPRTVDVHGVEFRVIGRPRYDVAHPRDDAHGLEDTLCGGCVLAICPDTGRILLVWACGPEETRNWSISRENPITPGVEVARKPHSCDCPYCE